MPREAPQPSVQRDRYKVTCTDFFLLLPNFFSVPSGPLCLADPFAVLPCSWEILLFHCALRLLRLIISLVVHLFLGASGKGVASRTWPARSRPTPFHDTDPLKRAVQSAPLADGSSSTVRWSLNLEVCQDRRLEGALSLGATPPFNLSPCRRFES